MAWREAEICFAGRRINTTSPCAPPPSLSCEPRCLHHACPPHPQPTHIQCTPRPHRWAMAPIHPPNTHLLAPCTPQSPLLPTQV